MNTAFVDFLEEASRKLSPKPEKPLTPEEQKSLYLSAFTLYRQKQYSIAEPLFIQLCLANPFEQSFWRGLASSLQMLGKLKGALRAWCATALLQDEDPLPHFHAAECFYLLKETQEATKALLQAEKRLQGAKELEILQENITILRTLLQTNS